MADFATQHVLLRPESARNRLGAGSVVHALDLASVAAGNCADGRPFETEKYQQS